jgi:hypothetical protein
MLILIEGDFELYKRNQANFAVPVDPNCTNAMQPGKSWVAQNTFGAHRNPPNIDLHYPSSHLVVFPLTEYQKAQFTRGGDIMQAQQLVDHGLWDHLDIDPESCGAMSTFTPVGPWPQSAYSLSLSHSHSMLKLWY